MKAGSARLEIAARVIVVEEIAAELLKAVFFNRLADALHQAEQIAEIVNRRQPSARDFARLDEVADIGAGEVAAGITVAAFLQRTKVMRILRVADDQSSLIGEAGSVAGDARRQHAVEHIHAAVYALDQTIRTADAHQIAGLVRRAYRT